MYCHKHCIHRYLLEYECTVENKFSVKSNSCKQNAWAEVAEELVMGLSYGEGFELSYIRDHLNKKTTSGGNVTK